MVTDTLLPGNRYEVGRAFRFSLPHCSESLQLAHTDAVPPSTQVDTSSRSWNVEASVHWGKSRM